MERYPTATSLLLLFLMLVSCHQKKATKKDEDEKRRTVEMVTNYGTITIELYNETPLHRDNFIQLAKAHAYDSVLFHRVIRNFMIQGGDPDSKRAQPQDTLGEGDVPYTIQAEFNPNLFHKRGVLAAARDGNPQRASSGMQFYIVQGKIYNDSLLDGAEIRINNWLAEHAIQNDLEHKYLLDTLQKANEVENTALYDRYKDSIQDWAKTSKSFQRYAIPKSQRDIYKSMGGAAHLDQNYTVYGEVIKGMDVVDSIAATPTGVFDRPVKDIRILTLRVIE